MGAVGSAVRTIGSQVFSFTDVVTRFAIAKKYFGDDGNAIIFALSQYMSPEVWSNNLVISSKFRNLFINSCQNQSTNSNDLNQVFQYFIIDPIIKMQWNTKIKQIIRDYPITNQGSKEICWAHALSTSIYLSQSRIIGRKIIPFNKMVQKLLNEFGSKCQNLENVMQKVLPRYKLHYRRALPNELSNIITNNRVCVAAFYLNEIEWFNFSKFFNNPNNKSRAITADVIRRIPKSNELRGADLEDGGHAVVLIEVKDDEYTFMNSWGQQWGDNGLFRVKSNAFKINFYDIFWYTSDLSSREIRLWKDRSIEAVRFFYEINIGIDPKIENFKQSIYEQPLLFLLKNCAKIANNQNIKSFPYLDKVREYLATISFDLNDENSAYQVGIEKNSSIVVNGFIFLPFAIEQMVTFVSLACTVYEVNDQIKEMIDLFWKSDE